jgi:putative transcriptional regulator
MRIFAGYSGWGPSQLDDELEMGGWLVVDVSSDELFGPCSQIWETLMNKVGRDIIGVLVAERAMPTDPSCN